ncbi:MAG: hypothetical protein ACI85U_003913 [Candidatus Promineifilaceae bacterium]|jgi:hypothetical protein
MSNNIINVIRTGSIGGVSGVKGGAFAGAVGGGTLMMLTGLTSLSDQVGFGFVILSTLIGLTTGMMTGALIGYFTGWLNGMVSGIGSDDGKLNFKRVNSTWVVTFLIIWAIVGYLLFNEFPLLGIFGGIGAGFLGSRIAIKDFVKMIEVQSLEIDPDDLRTDKDRWKQPEAQS